MDKRLGLHKGCLMRIKGSTASFIFINAILKEDIQFITIDPNNNTGIVAMYGDPKISKQKMQKAINIIPESIGCEIVDGYFHVTYLEKPPTEDQVKDADFSMWHPREKLCVDLYTDLAQATSAYSKSLTVETQTRS